MYTHILYSYCTPLYCTLIFLFYTVLKCYSSIVYPHCTLLYCTLIVLLHTVLLLYSIILYSNCTIIYCTLIVLLYTLLSLYSSIMYFYFNLLLISTFLYSSFIYSSVLFYVYRFYFTLLFSTVKYITLLNTNLYIYYMARVWVKTHLAKTTTPNCQNSQDIAKNTPKKEKITRKLNTLLKQRETLLTFYPRTSNFKRPLVVRLYHISCLYRT